MEPGRGRTLPGLMYHTSGIGGGLLRLSREVNFSEEDGEEEQPLTQPLSPPVDLETR